MALRDQPYIPLYVQDYLSDEKLSLCTYSTQGIYVRIMCIFHKSENYGGILFKQIPKQNFSSSEYFVYSLSKQTGVDLSDMKDAIEELLFHGILKIGQIEGVDFIYQKRMVKDFSKSESRSKAGKKGGGNPNLFKQKHKQNTEYENENENESVVELKIEKGVTGEKEVKKKKSKKDIAELQFPFTSKEFIDNWTFLIDMPKWKKKIPHSLQLALNSLGKYHEAFAIELIQKAIENNWQGVTYPDTDEQYQKWLGRNGKIIKTPQASDTADKDFLSAVANGLARGIRQRDEQSGNSKFRQNTYGSNAEDKKRSVDRLADLAETILKNP